MSFDSLSPSAYSVINDLSRFVHYRKVTQALLRA